jgi:hypothetical protein
MEALEKDILPYVESATWPKDLIDKLRDLNCTGLFS